MARTHSRLRRWLAGTLAAAAGWLLAASAAAAPVTGLFLSDDLDGGVFLTGRWTEGYVVGDPLGLGNGLHAGSWDAATATLFTDWELTGPRLAAVQVDDYRTPAGDGVVVTTRDFDPSAAVLILKDRPWWTAPGDGDYTVALDRYTQTITALYQGGTPRFVHSSETFGGRFLGHPGYTLLGQMNWARVGEGAAPPADYPAWEPAGAPSGAWGDVGQARLSIVPEPGALALLGGGLATWLVAGRKRSPSAGGR